MPLQYEITSNGYYFGLKYQGTEVIPCNNNKLWRITKDLIGFRQDNQFGIYSTLENRILHDATLSAEVTYFQRINDKEGALVTKSRFVSTHPGVFIKTKEYLEVCDFLLWKGNRLLVLSPEGILVILRNGEIRKYNGKKPKEALDRLQQRCLFEDEHGYVVKSELPKFDYLTEADREIDEDNFLNSFIPQEVVTEAVHTSGKPNSPASDLEMEEPIFKYYNFNEIPPIIREKFINHLDRFYNTPTNDKLTKFLIYLAWCHANGFIKYDQKGNCTIDPWYASLPDFVEFPSTVDRLYEAHQLKGLQHLLYISPLTEGYLEVLALVN
ncbi:hypothetical protein [Rufibacter roseus]|uniref:Uncharacterized protein n=1 Tax=Rufibacter roseus TaxID=1567108 RepID=A0ABW2DME1_9BACT|nr:hypothetical protein [Rufibacter roseus]